MPWDTLTFWILFFLLDQHRKLPDRYQGKCPTRSLGDILSSLFDILISTPKCILFTYFQFKGEPNEKC